MRQLAFLALFAASVAHAQPTPTRTYSLAVPPSSFDVGCQGPCDCAIFSRPTYGSFNLVSTGFDGLYDTYRVERYIASFNNGPGAVALTGAGTFRIGGEVAYQQEMIQQNGHMMEDFAGVASLLCGDLLGGHTQ